MSTKKNEDVVTRATRGIKEIGIRSSRLGPVLVATLIVLLLSGLAVTAASADEKHVALDGTITGRVDGFEPVPPNFGGVLATGIGSADDLGTFAYSGFLVQDLSNVPSVCDPPIGATGVRGSSVMTFDGGVLLLERTSAQECFDIELGTFNAVENFVVAGGSGRFDEAKGDLTIEITGSLDDFTLDATFSGKIKLDDDDQKKGKED